MPLIIDENSPLPQFRSDLALYRGPDAPDGSPTFNLFDPVRAQYFKISWGESLILQLCRQQMTLRQLCDAIEQHSTLKVTPEEVKIFFDDALRNNLLAVSKTSDVVGREARQARVGYVKKFLYSYLYFRLPLLEPDRFLTKTLPYVRPLVSRTAFILYAILTCVGFFLLINRFDEYIHTFTYFFNFNGLLGYFLGIFLVKIIHEFAHAYTANYYKIHIPNMGVAFIIMWPVLYTDVTDSWKLAKRNQRLAISASGIMAELVLAGLCTLGWVLSEPGLLQSVFFVISSITWVSTLIINLNPAMRFDGYYLLCDLWGIDNLQPRSFALTRWWLRKTLLGIDMPSPEEEELTAGLFWGMLLYALYTWVYRLVLYTAVAIFVYYRFTKVLGIFLFLVEIVVFIIQPIISEIVELGRLKGYFKTNPKLVSTVTAFTVLVIWMILPLPHVDRFPAVVVAENEETLYVPQTAVLEKINVKKGDKVAAGEPLAVLESKKLDIDIRDFELREKIAERDIYILGLNDKDRSYIAGKESELAAIREELKRLRAKKRMLTIKAGIDGYIESWEENLKVTQTLAGNQVLGKIADRSSLKVISFVPENRLYMLKVGEKVKFKPSTRSDTFEGKVTAVFTSSSDYLAYPGLASIHRGPLAVVEQRQEKGEMKLKMVDAYYQIEIKLDKEDAQLRFGQTGVVDVEGPWSSILMSVWEFLVRLFWRESGF